MCNYVSTNSTPKIGSSFSRAHGKRPCKRQELGLKGNFVVEDMASSSGQYQAGLKLVDSRHFQGLAA